MIETTDEKMQDRDHGFDTRCCVVDVLAALDQALGGA
jgi:hypothetical protein